MKKIFAILFFFFSITALMSQNRVLDTLIFFRGGKLYKISIQGQTLTINDTSFVGFPGFGNDHTHAACGDHTHAAQTVISCEILAGGDASNSWATPFVLKSTTVVYYNSSPIRATQWSGVGSSILTVSLDVRKWDQLLIIN
jgi:hypothetical protein